MKRPDVSIIIPTINGREAFLQRAIASVNEPSLNIQLVISTTDAFSQFEMLRGKFRSIDFCFVKHDGLGTAAENRNIALDAATGNYIAFLDDDDEFVDGKLAIQLEKMKRAEARWSFANYFLCCGSPHERCKRFSARTMLRKNLDLNENCAIATPTVVVERELLDDNGLRFDNRLELREDIDLWSRLLDRWPALYVPKPLALVHRSSESSYLRQVRQTEGPGIIASLAQCIAAFQRTTLDSIDILLDRKRMIASQSS